MLATNGPHGLDCSPRGDAAGFVRVADERTLLIPDRRGNNRIDSLRNILHDQRVGLLFLIPGVGETLRVRGRSTISVEPALLESFVTDVGAGRLTPEEGQTISAIVAKPPSCFPRSSCGRDPSIERAARHRRRAPTPHRRQSAGPLRSPDTFLPQLRRELSLDRAPVAAAPAGGRHPRALTGSGTEPAPDRQRVGCVTHTNVDKSVSLKETC